MRAVIISFDSLAANSLGCYGNEWIETPNWDRIAATGAVFDQHFVDTIGPLAGMAWSTGHHSLRPPSLTDQQNLASVLTIHQVASRLVVADDVRVWQRTIPFDEIEIVQGHDGPDANPDETPFAKVVQAGVALWNDPGFQQRSRILWLHASGPGTPPAGFDELYFEDFEERGQQLSELSEEARSQHPAVYAGAVSLLDHWLGELLSGLRLDSTDEPTLVIVMAAQGDHWHQIRPKNSDEFSFFPQSFSDQMAKTPLVLKVYGDDRFQDLVCLRSNRLVQMCDLVPTLTDWFHTSSCGSSVPLAGSWLRELTEEIPGRKTLHYGDGERVNAVRSETWLCLQETVLRSDADEGVASPRTSLYSKPEDVWDVNDIASQQPEVVIELLARIPDRDERPPHDAEGMEQSSTR